MRAYFFHPEAMAEADTAAVFYEERQQGLGARFVAALDDAIDRICRNPEYIQGGGSRCTQMPPHAVSLRCNFQGAE